MELSTLKKDNGYKRSRRVGRGGKRGKTSGRGGKGQTARAGNKRRPEWRDAIKKIPKRRGYGKNRGRTVVPSVRAISINFALISKIFKQGDVVSPRSLLSKGVIRPVSGKLPPVKILAVGDLTLKLAFESVRISAKAKDIIEKAGGTIK